ncbi:MAG: hypothetical protein K8R90_06030 [Candidatus Cloacimonetes bacterium]|nr:hypothetical protein [Candidatus Cloacimonadota bacterium]
MLLTILRDSCLNVGDVWVADGHKLAFDIIDPKTGRPKRMTRCACRAVHGHLQGSEYCRQTRLPDA